MDSSAQTGCIMEQEVSETCQVFLRARRSGGMHKGARNITFCGLGTAGGLALALFLITGAPVKGMAIGLPAARLAVSEGEPQAGAAFPLSYNAWSPRTAMPTGRNLPASAVLSDTVFVIGGRIESGALITAEADDPLAAGWLPNAGMLTDRNALGGKICAADGWSGTAMTMTAAVEAYDPVADEWTPLDPLPHGRNELAAARGEILALGGSYPPTSNAMYEPPAPHALFLPAVLRSARPSHDHVARPRFQVFILNPVRTCLVGNDFASGSVCRGTNCGDCDCTWEQFDPRAPLVGVGPEHVNDPQYDAFKYKVCVEVTLTQAEVDGIIADMQLVREEVLEWSGGALDLQLQFTVLSHDHVGFVAPDFVFGPFEVDDELLNPYVSTETDFVYVVTGVYDRAQGVHLAYACGGSYGEMSVHGAGYANIQYNDICGLATFAGRQVYEALVHEWLHNLDWALYYIDRVPDLYQHVGPDWAHWQHGDWPACGTGDPNPLAWFPSIDYCEWDPDWIDCNNIGSAGRCVHAGEVGGAMSWYEHVIAAHYPRGIEFIGNHCRDGRQDFGETGVDQGGPCP